MWKSIKDVLFWRYQRGSLQYDLMCLVILAFIFLTPASVFDGTLFTGERTAGAAGNIQPSEPAPRPSVTVRSAIKASPVDEDDNGRDQDVR